MRLTTASITSSLKKILIKDMIRFIAHSYIFRHIVIISFYFILIFIISDKYFDYIWKTYCSIPLTNLSDVYVPPPNYDNIKKINLKLQLPNKILFEGNKKLKLLGTNKDFDYYDTANLVYSKSSNYSINKMLFSFEHSHYNDSIIVLITREPASGKVWFQIFYSSVVVEDANDFSKDPKNFRINYSQLVDSALLNNNDTLISGSIQYFNQNKDNLKLGDCSANSKAFKSVCDKFKLPCRNINLQGGDLSDVGLNNRLGYPLHVVCEVYSSTFKKWFVADPTYGFIFKLENIPLSAVEISDAFFFHKDYEINQDSAFFTKQSLLGRDYFKFYENVTYYVNKNPTSLYGRLYNRLIRIFYGRFDQYALLYANDLNPRANGTNYLELKSLLYLIIIIIYINFIIITIIKRLYLIKQDRNN